MKKIWTYVVLCAFMYSQTVQASLLASLASLNLSLATINQSVEIPEYKAQLVKVILKQEPTEPRIRPYLVQALPNILIGGWITVTYFLITKHNKERSETDEMLEKFVQQALSLETHVENFPTHGDQCEVYAHRLISYVQNLQITYINYAQSANQVGRTKALTRLNEIYMIYSSYYSKHMLYFLDRWKDEIPAPLKSEMVLPSIEQLSENINLNNQVKVAFIEE